MSRPWPPSARVLVAVAIVVAMAVTAVVLRGMRGQPPRLGATTPPPRPSTTVNPSPLPLDTDLLAAGAEATLPPLATELGETVRLDTTAPALSTDPVRRALALVLVGSPDGPQVVLVLGDDGRTRRLDVELAPATDPDGNPRSAVSTRSLSPDGRRAAFPQRDRLLLVNLTTGRVEAVPLPGFNESVVWLGDRVAVARDDGTRVVDTGSLAVTRAPFPAALAASSVTEDPTVMTLTGGYEERLSVRVWAGAARREVEITDIPIGTRWAGPGARDGDVVAAPYASASLADRGRTIALITDVGTDVGPVRRRLLIAGTDRSSTMVLSWLGRHIVLLWRGEATGWVLAWNSATGEVYRVAEVRANLPVVAVSLPHLAAP